MEGRVILFTPLQLEGGQVVGCRREQDGLLLLDREAVLESTILDDGIRPPLPLKQLCTLHLKFEWGFTPRNGYAVAVENDVRRRLPSATTGSFAEYRRSTERVRVKLTIGPLEVLREG